MKRGRGGRGDQTPKRCRIIYCIVLEKIHGRLPLHGEKSYNPALTHQFFLFFIIISAKTYLPQPRVYSSKQDVLKDREGFTVTCSADSPLQSSMELSWDYPGKEVGNSTAYLSFFMLVV